MRRCDFVKIVKHHFPTWEVNQESTECICFRDNGVDVGWVTSYCPYTDKTYKDKAGYHVAMYISHSAVAGLKALGMIHGVKVHQ